MAKMKSDETKYVQIIQQQSKETPTIIPLLLFIKADAAENEFFYLIIFFLRFIGLLIISCDFNIDTSKSNSDLSLSFIFRYLTAYGIVDKCHISNNAYIIISFILFLFLIIMGIFYYNTLRTIKKKIQLSKISTFKIQIVIDHIIFFGFPFIIEFLSFIFYIFIFGDKFIIKKTAPSYLNTLVLVINSISLVAYNIQSFFHILSVNNPIDEYNSKVKLRYGDKKILIFNLVQNNIIIEALPLYLNNSTLRIYQIAINSLILVFFTTLFFYSYLNYNYQTKTNYLLSILSIFCFFSILIEIVSYLVGYKIESNLILFFFTLLKIIISFFFQHFSNSIYENKMTDLAQEELFKIYNNTNVLSDKIYDVLLYFYDILMTIKRDNGNANTKRLINIIMLHKSKCHSNNCKCRYIQIFPRGKKYSKIYINSLLERIFFLLESIFVELDYSKNNELALILAEHYNNFRNNPILSYSMIQTVLYFHTKSLRINNILILFTALHKYIEKCNNNNCLSISESIENSLNNKHGGRLNDNNNSISSIQMAKLYKSIYHNYKYLMNTKKVLKKYAMDYLQLLKYKENLEETVQIKRDENNDITKIRSLFLTTKNLSKIISILLGEIDMNANLISYLQELDANKIPISLIYECFLYAELFLCGKIPNEVMTLMYSFSSERNLYTQKIQYDTMVKIKAKYEESKRKNIYYLIFKFSNGMNIHYFDEELSKKLGYLQKDLLRSGIEKIMPKELSYPHYCAAIQYLINRKNKIVHYKECFFFDKEMHMYHSYIEGVCMPGLGKYLFCIIKSHIDENKNVYYFYLNKNAECISLTHNFYENYNISLNIINKFRISLLELIDIPKDDLDCFKSEIKKISQFNNYLDMKTDYFYSLKLFKEKTKFHAGHNNFQLLEIMKNSETQFNEENNNLMINAEEPQIANIEHILFSHDLNIKDHMTFHKKKVVKSRRTVLKKICEVIYRNNENDRNNKDYTQLSSVSLKFLSAASSDKKGGQNSKFFIEYGLTMIYNAYFYIFKMNEVFHEHPNALLKSVKNEGLFNNKTSLKNENKPRGQENENSNTGAENIENKKTNNVIINKVYCFSYITFLTMLILSSLFVTYVIILFYQRNMVSSNHKSFLIYYYNFYQRDKLYELFSILLSSFFHYMNITDYSDIMNSTDYIDLLFYYSCDFQRGYHLFYDAYVTYKNQENKPIHLIFDNRNITKIDTYFKDTNFTSSYTHEAEYISYISRYSSKEDIYDNIIEDSKMFIFHQFKNQTQIKTRSHYIQALYYLCKNFISIFSKIFTELESEVTLEFENLSYESKETYIYVEILGFLIIVSFFIIVLIFLHQTNQAIFRNIINMFIDFTQGDNFKYKNREDNLTLIKIVSSFIVVINDFNSDNLNNLYHNISNNYNTQENNNNNNNNNTISTTNFLYMKANDKSPMSINSRNPRFEIKKVIPKVNESSENVKSNISSSHIELMTNDLSGMLNQNSSQNNQNKIMGLQKKKTEEIRKRKSVSNGNANSKNKKSTELKTKEIESLEGSDIKSAEMFVKKLENKGIRDIKLSKFLLLVLFLIVIIYVSTKIGISLDFITEIRGIFEDFGILAYRYSLVYYYFNAIRTLLIIPDFGKEEIFEGINEYVQSIEKQMNYVFEFELEKYPHVNDFYSLLLSQKIGAGNDKDDEVPIEIICEGNEKCINVIKNPRYNLLKQGLKIAATSTFQQITNIYHDYQTMRNNITNIDDIKNKFINNQFEQIDMNLNYVYSSIQERIYQVFMKDLNSLVNKYNSMIEALNLCAIIYCCIIAVTVMTFVIFYLRKITIRIEEATVRINNAFCYMVHKNMYYDNKEEQGSLIEIEN